MSAPAAIEIDGLIKDFWPGLRGGRVRAVDGLTLRAPAGEIFGLLGPNGCGKSTTLKILAGLTAPSAGACRVLGRSAGEAARRGLVGYLPESPRFPRYLTGRETLRDHARLVGIAPRDRANRVAATLERVGLDAAADRRVGAYSKGLAQRLGLAQALVHDPAVLLLDEPLDGLDPGAADAFLATLRRLRDTGKTIVVTSHVLPDVEAICDRVALLHRGRVVLEGPVSTLVGSASRQVVIIDALPPREQAELRDWLAARGRTLHDVAPATDGGLGRVFRERLLAERPSER